MIILDNSRKDGGMKGKMKIKITLDLFMTVVLLALMAFQITGQELHEWFGAGMLVLFLAHNILNFKWYKNLFKGRYTMFRVLQTVIDLAVLAAMLCLAYSGMLMSRYALSFIPLGGSMALARQMHMAASYWGFVLMSIHAGLHYGMVVSIAGKAVKDRKIPKAAVWVLRVFAILIAAYGTVCFYRADIISYMLLTNQFAFFDFEQSAVSVFTEYAAMMGLWIWFSYYLAKILKRNSSAKVKKERKCKCITNGRDYDLK